MTSYFVGLLSDDLIYPTSHPPKHKSPSNSKRTLSKAAHRLNP